MSSKPERKKFRIHKYRGVTLDDLVLLSHEELKPLLKSRQRRKLNRGLQGGELKLLAKVKTSIESVKGEAGVKPPVVKTHLRSMIVLPEMVGAQIAIYNGKEFNVVEIKAPMIGHYLGEFSLTYVPVTHKTKSK
eukprot:TRINITY_DN1031_c0_g1_i1.p1 TRINITY_DN1031_c0_g1~~TRINITY_DN1031_c0_g1_i1.p1  ORF type:complete len:134 (+),score=19.01 TRINITY_DN1031_c0_g1_i1:40-441(+)